MKKVGGVRVKREDSDEWLCSSTHRPNHNEIIGKEVKRKKKKTLTVVNLPKTTTTLTPKLERLNSEGFRKSEDVKLTSSASRKPITPQISRNPSINEIRQSPEEVFASLTPKRRRSIDIVRPPSKKRKEDVIVVQEEPTKSEDSDSDVSNIFENMPPLNSPAKTHYSPKFITAYESQFTQFAEDVESPDLFDSSESSESMEPSEHHMSIESIPQEDPDLDGTPFDIEVSPVKVFQKQEEKVEVVQKKLRFEIEESCALGATSKEYAIDIETCGFREEETVLHEETQKYTQAENQCASSSSLTPDELQKQELLGRDDLSGLAARFASLMSGKSSERRLLMSDVTFGMVPRRSFVKLEVERCLRAFGITILGSSCSLIISRSSSSRRLAPSPAAAAAAVAVSPFICGPAHRDAAPSPFSSSIPPVYYTIGALPSSPKTTIRLRDDRQIPVIINPPLVTEGAL